jgi:hypothetical protein
MTNPQLKKQLEGRRFPPPSVVVSRTQLGENTDDVGLSDIRYAMHYGRNSDIARGPKRGQSLVRHLQVGERA